jgi:hypothetical protein
VANSEVYTLIATKNNRQKTLRLLNKKKVQQIMLELSARGWAIKVHLSKKLQ